jgi:hypothetical protein
MSAGILYHKTKRVFRKLRTSVFRYDYTWILEIDLDLKFHHTN